MRKCRSAGHRSRHAALWRRLALAAAVFCLCWHLADCIEDAMWPAMREVAQHECRSLVVQCLNTAVYDELSANPQRYAGLYHSQLFLTDKLEPEYRIIRGHNHH